MKKIILMFCFAILGMSALTSCHSVSPDADEEAVIVKKPWFIGHGGVEQQAVQTGLTWCWLVNEWLLLQDCSSPS